MKTYKEFVTEAITKPEYRGAIAKVVDSAASSIIGKNLTPGNLAKIIRQKIRKVWPRVGITVLKVKGLESGEMNINAYYDPSNDFTNMFGDDENEIEIELLVSPEDKQLNIGEEGWIFLSSRLTDALHHEMLHKSQYRNRGFKQPKKFTKFTSKIPNIMQTQQYLGSSDEIEAFALNISNELVNSLGSQEAALKSLRSFSKTDLKTSVNLWAYLQSFEMDKNHPVIKKLIKKVVEYIKSQ